MACAEGVWVEKFAFAWYVKGRNVLGSRRIFCSNTSRVDIVVAFGFLVADMLGWNHALVMQLYEGLPLDLYGPLRAVDRQFCAWLPDFDLEFVRVVRLLCVMRSPPRQLYCDDSWEACVQLRFVLGWSSGRASVVQLLCLHLELIHAVVLRFRSAEKRFDCLQLLLDLAELCSEVKSFVVSQHFAARRAALTHLGFVPCVLRVDGPSSRSLYLSVGCSLFWSCLFL